MWSRLVVQVHQPWEPGSPARVPCLLHSARQLFLTAGRHSRPPVRRTETARSLVRALHERAHEHTDEAGHMSHNTSPSAANVTDRSAADLVAALVAGDVQAVRERFAGPADIDDPRDGRQIDGGLERMVRNWAPVTLATLRQYEVQHVTVGAGGRFSATEVHFDLERDGARQDLDVVVVSEFDAGGGLLRCRLYYRLARLTGVQHQRTRILPEEPVRVEPDLPGMEAYQRTLRAGDAEGMTATFTDDAVFDGHGESHDLRDAVGMGRFAGRDEIRGVLTQMFDIADEEASHSGDGRNGIILEKLNMFNDGTTTVVEFNIIHKNHPVNRVSAGVAAYELDSTGGRLVSARIYDEAW